MTHFLRAADMFEGFPPSNWAPTRLPSMVDAHHATRGAVSVRGVIDGAPAQFYCLDDAMGGHGWPWGLVLQNKEGEFTGVDSQTKILIKSRCNSMYLVISEIF